MANLDTVHDVTDTAGNAGTIRVDAGTTPDEFARWYWGGEPLDNHEVNAPLAAVLRGLQTGDRARSAEDYLALAVDAHPAVTQAAVAIESVGYDHNGARVGVKPATYPPGSNVRAPGRWHVVEYELDADGVTFAVYVVLAMFSNRSDALEDAKRRTS